MKLTKIEIWVMVIIATLVLFLAVYIPISVRLVHKETAQTIEYVQKRGVKNILKKIWEGDSTADGSDH